MRAETPLRSETPLLSVQGLTVTFDGFTAVSELSFDLYEGQTLAIVGESGSGKSVTALSIMRLVTLGTRAKIAEGQIFFRQPDGSTIDLVQADEAELRKIRGNQISMIFQEPLTSLNPVYTAGNQVVEAIRLHQDVTKAEAYQRAFEVFERVRIPEPKKRLKEYPHQMSGGMRQRVMIAMALSCDPTVLIADEPTTALDVTIQAQILGLMRALQDETGAAVIMITHDMGVVAEVADDIVVMRNSKLVETGNVFDIFEKPTAPYTKALLASIPRLGSMTGKSQPERFDLVDMDAPV
ncbi:MAG: ABC transporter ATP-binding protein [Acidimicrobiales bacterium]|jgi:glutathione transport system ATP-binding protein|tara:strand:+ start:2123 stop:3007 length:885 start_codon:yes stop_codon:yes gene_type:complete